MKDFRKNFLNDWEEQGGLIRQTDACNLLGWKRQRLFSRIKTGSVKSYEYIYKEKKIVYVSLNDIKKIAIEEI